MKPHAEALEVRLLLSADPLDDHDHDHDHDHDLELTPVLPQLAEDSGPGGSTEILVQATSSAIPALNSHPSATATLYLDFDGHTEASWGAYSNIVTPAFDLDGNTSTFSTTEVAAMERIWAQVAEDYAPFNINVTTVEPGSFANGVELRVVIGGNGSWTGGTYGGVAYVNSFTSSIPNTVFVFSKNLGSSAKNSAEAASHEAGHAFGLRHQSLYNSSGQLAQQYYTGPGDGTAPIMGNSYSAARGLWWYGTTTSRTTFQDDMAVISRSTNGFGYRPDDHADTSSTATSLDVSGGQFSGGGIITQTSDVDYFSFSSGAGEISIAVSVPANINNLDARLELRDATGAVVASAAPSNSFGATLTVTVEAGDYWLVVASQGDYGDVGAYSISGNVVAVSTAIESVQSPTNLQPSATLSGVALAWTDNATNETGYRVERSLDGQTWTVLASSLTAGSTSYVDGGVVPGGVYIYRVQAFNGRSAAYSEEAGIVLAPAAPGSLSATAVSSSRIDLTWTDVAGETGYRIERSLDGKSWTQVGSAGANVTTYSSTGLNASTTYLYRVLAQNGGGSSAPSGTASATTQAAPTIPSAPSGLTAQAPAFNLVNLSWRDNSGNETGFVIERSTNARTFSVVGTVGAGVTTFTDSTVKAKTQYGYRVRALGVTGSSAFSNLAVVATPTAPKNGGGPNAAALPQDATPPASAKGLAQELVGRIASSVKPTVVSVPALEGLVAGGSSRAAAAAAVDEIFASIITALPKSEVIGKLR